jgi:hypothetical protein
LIFAQCWIDVRDVKGENRQKNDIELLKQEKTFERKDLKMRSKIEGLS